jgi:hypothetical protein
VVTSLLSLRAKTATLLKLRAGAAAAAGAAAGGGGGGIGAGGQGHHLADDIIGEEEIPAELVQVRWGGRAGCVAADAGASLPLSGGSVGGGGGGGGLPRRWAEAAWGVWLKAWALPCPLRRGRAPARL